MPNRCRSYPQAADRWPHATSVVVYGHPGEQTGEDGWEHRTTHRRWTRVRLIRGANWPTSDGIVASTPSSSDWPASSRHARRGRASHGEPVTGSTVDRGSVGEL